MRKGNAEGKSPAAHLFSREVRRPPRRLADSVSPEGVANTPGATKAAMTVPPTPCKYRATLR